MSTWQSPHREDFLRIKVTVTHPPNGIFPFLYIIIGDNERKRDVGVGGGLNLAQHHRAKAKQDGFESKDLPTKKKKKGYYDIIKYERSVS